jgi:hypothetical protein
MVKEHDHPSNHRLEEEGMDIADIHMMEVDGMDMVEEHPSNRQSEDAGMDMVEERLVNHRPEVEGINKENINIVEDMTMERGG